VKPVVAISVGCPSGIGPEVAVAAAARSSEAASVLVGDPWVIERAARIVGVSRRRLVAIDEPRSMRRVLEKTKGAIGYFTAAVRIAERDARFGRPTRGAGRAQLAWIDQAADLAEIG